MSLSPSKSDRSSDMEDEKGGINRPSKNADVVFFRFGSDAPHPFEER
jgi:hypothetical protein